MSAVSEAFTIDSTPEASGDIEVAVFEGEAVLFHEPTGSVHRLNATTAAVWLSCDGETTAAQIIDDLSGMFIGDRDQISSAVFEALEQLRACGLLGQPSSQPTFRLAPDESEPASDGSTVIACPPDY